MKSFRVHIRVSFKEGLLDPQAETLLSALRQLDFKAVDSLRCDKLFVLNVKAESETQALQQGREMAQRLLANVVMENFEVEVQA